MSTNDKIVKMFWAAGHEIVYENEESKGITCRSMSIEEVLEMIELFSEAAFGLNLDENLLFNPNGAMVNELPIDVAAQVFR